MNKRKSNYIYIEMRHKMLIVGVIIIQVCRNIFLTFPILQAFQPIH